MTLFTEIARTVLYPKLVQSTRLLSKLHDISAPSFLMTSLTPNQYEMPTLVGKGGEKGYAVNYKPVGVDDPTTPSQDEHLSKYRPSAVSPTHNALVLSRRRRFLTTFRALRAALLPLVAIAYLAFCYTVHYKVVQVKTRIFDDTAANLCGLSFFFSVL